MEQLNHDAFCQSVQPPNLPDMRVPSDRLHSDSRLESEVTHSIAARKVQKADREKLRRDRLNEQFTELGNALDPDRPKNDKASILTDTIQILKDLTAEVNRLKSECTSLTEESRELSQEKNDLREEKSSLKNDIENLNLQYQQRLRAMFPWAGMEHSVVMQPPSFPFPLPMPIPPGTIPLHPSLQPYPYFGNQNPAMVPSPSSTFVPYLTPHTLTEQQSTPYVSPVMQPGRRSEVSSQQDSRNKLSDQVESKIGKSEDSDEVATDLELKTPGSTVDQISSSGQKRSKKLSRKENGTTDGGSSSRCSSSRSVQASSSNSIVAGMKADD
ncbi:unnamed protein product [Ilex paraguariensis]|uniref:BHLH domain-containing protein n=1 Tax=Ilex paraguariensis TaxID=185542 RepID=A0ABC8SYD0_9AQUA